MYSACCRAEERSSNIFLHLNFAPDDIGMLGKALRGKLDTCSHEKAGNLRFYENTFRCFLHALHPSGLTIYFNQLTFSNVSVFKCFCFKMFFFLLMFLFSNVSVFKFFCF